MALWLVPETSSAQRVTASVTFTNVAGTTNGQTLTVNAAVRTFTNSVVISSTQIGTNSTPDGSKTNAFKQIGLNPFSQVTMLDGGVTNFTLAGASGVAMAVALSAGVGTVTYSTQVVATVTEFRIPWESEAIGQRTNVVSNVARALDSSSSTNVVHENAPAMANFMGLTNVQLSVPGAKGLTNLANLVNGTMVLISGSYVTNPAANVCDFSIIGSAGTGGHASLLECTPAGLIISTVGTIYLHNPVDMNGDMALNTFNIVGGRIQIGTNGFVGNGASLTNIPANGLQVGTVDGSAVTNQLVVPGKICFPRFPITSLGNGNNSDLPIGTNTFIEVSGPSGAFAILGIAGGRDGQLCTVINQTGFNMTIATEGGATGNDTTAANRIISMSGADRATTGNGAATFMYSGAASRWILIAFEP
jgi:hypothetical protein